MKDALDELAALLAPPKPALALAAKVPS